MVKGDRSDYNEPEHEKKLRELGQGGLTCTPRKWLPSKQVPPLPFVEDEYGSELTKGDKVLHNDEFYYVNSVDVSAKTVDIGLDEPIAGTECVGRVRNMEELVDDGLLPRNILKDGGQYRQIRERLYTPERKPRAGHRDYRFSYLGRKRLKTSVREKDAETRRESRARRKDKDDEVLPRVRDGSGEMNYRTKSRAHAKNVAAILKTCPCNSGLDRDWCDKCDLRGSGKSRRYFSVAAPLYGGTSDDSHKELTGMSRDDFAKYLEACMHPAPPDVKAELLGARRMLHGRPVGSMEREHVCPKSAYQRAVGQMIGFAADGKTPNKAAKGSYLFCELQLMFHADNARKGRGFGDDLRRLYEERLLCCMSPRSLAFYKVDRLDPRVTFFKIDTIVRKLKAWGEARAKELGSEVFVPIGAKAGWLARARVTMAEDARAIRAWQRDRGEAVDDEDEEEAAVDEHERQAAARERAARCVEIKVTAPHAIDAMEDDTYPHRRSGARRTAPRATRRRARRSRAAGPSARRCASCRRRRRRGGGGGFPSMRPSARFTGSGGATCRRRSSRCAATATSTSSSTTASAASCRRISCGRWSATCNIGRAKSSRHFLRGIGAFTGRPSRGAATTSTRSRSTTPVAAPSCRRSSSASRRRDSGRRLLRRARRHRLLGMSRHRLVRRRGGRSGRFRRLRLLRGPSGASGEESKLLVF